MTELNKNDKANDNNQQNIFNDLQKQIKVLEDELVAVSKGDSVSTKDVVKINRLVKSIWSLASIFLALVSSTSYIYIESKRALDAIEENNTAIVEIRKEDKKVLELVKKALEKNDEELSKIINIKVDDRLSDLVKITKEAADDAKDSRELVEESAQAMAGMNDSVRANYKELLRYKKEVTVRLQRIEKKLKAK